MREGNSCGILIRQIHSTLEKNANNSLRGQGLTFAQVSALLAIRDFPGQEIPLKELEKLLGIAQSTTAGIISRLERKGLVTALGDAADKRVKLVRLSPKGEAACRQAEEDKRRMEEQLLLGLTETEREILRSLLKKVKDTMQ